MFKNYEECLRASVGLWGIDPEEKTTWFHCPQTKVEEGCFCNELYEDQKDCGEVEWISKFCEPILQAEKAEQNAHVVSFCIFISFLCALSAMVQHA